MSSVFAEGPPLVRLALGRGKNAKTQFQLASYERIVQELKRLPPEISKKYQVAALKKAAKPGVDALRSQVAGIRQVTGNLLASVTSVSRKYDNSKSQTPVGVVVIGFRRPVNAGSQKMAQAAFEGGGIKRGPNRAYHSHLVEFGSRPKTPGIKTGRRTNRRRVILDGKIRTLADRVVEFSGASRRVLSSGFNNKSTADERKGKRRQFKGRGQYPIDFVATGTVAGARPLRPLAKAFAASKGQMQSVLDAELRRALLLASKAYAKKFGEGGLL